MIKKIALGLLSFILLFQGLGLATAHDTTKLEAKLEITLRNNISVYGAQRGKDFMSYFHYLRAKHPDNVDVQTILGRMIEVFETQIPSSSDKKKDLIEIIEVPVEVPVEVEAPEKVTSLWEFPGSTERLVSEGVFDEDAVEQAWIGWVNDEIRVPRGLDPVKSEWRLRETARDRSLSLREKGVADHKRFSYSGYYDYKDITKRFSDRGIVFKNVNRATSTENIGWARHTCEGDACTDAVIKDIRRIYDYFASEESYNGVHRRTMIHPEFKIVGISFAIDGKNDKVFAVMHYGTALE